MVRAKVYKDEKVIRDQSMDITILPTNGTISISYVPEEGFTKID